jgi:hypothetical protein
MSQDLLDQIAKIDLPKKVCQNGMGQVSLNIAKNC